VQSEQTDGETLSAVRSRQQQLLKQRQLMRQQQQHRKRQEVAAWALTQGHQHPAAVPVTAGADPTQDVQQDSLDQAAAAAAAFGAVSVVGACLADGELVLATTTTQQQALSADDATAAAEAIDGFEHKPAELAFGGLGLQRCDSMALSVADSFEGQSWAAWSTTSSISRCPKLQWWGNESGQGRFSQRQQRRLQQQQQRQGLPGGAASSEAGWWQRLLQARQEGSGAGRGGPGSSAGPSVGPQ
jgi:hypothetical protein